MSAPYFQRTRPDLCHTHDHPPVTYNPWLDRTWCLCGEVVRDGDAIDKDVPHLACCGGPLTEGDAPMTTLLTPDQYIDLLVQRQNLYQAKHPRIYGFPPLLDWFIEPGDEYLVDMTEIEASTTPEPPRPKRPRRYRPASHWRAELDRVETRMAAIDGIQRHHTTDPAAYGGLGIRQTARQARRYGEQIDRAAAEYVRLEKRHRHAKRMLRAARGREARQNSVTSPRETQYRTGQEGTTDEASESSPVSSGDHT